MNNKEIFTNAIDKAIVNGYDQFNTITSMNILLENRLKIENSSLRGIITSHSFAKAFWGEEPLTENYYQQHTKEISIKGAEGQHIKLLYAWQYHLQQIVLCENPITYLKKFL